MSTILRWGGVLGLATMIMYSGAMFAAERQFAFMANGLDYSLSRFSIEPESGGLRHLGFTPLPKLPATVVVHPSGRFVYAISKTPDKIAAFRLDPVSGDLTPVPGSPFDSAAHSPYAMAFHPSGRFAYVAARYAGVGAYGVNLETGALTPLPGSPFKAENLPRSVAVHPNGRFMFAVNAYSNNVSVYAIDQASGGLSPAPGSPFSVGDMGVIDYKALAMEDVPPEAGGIPYHIALDPAGRFAFVTNWAAASVTVFRIDADTGRLTPVDGSPFFSGFNPYSVWMHPSGRFVYVAQWSASQIMVHAVDTATGRLRPVPGAPFASGGEGPVAVTFNDQGTRAYVTHFESNDVARFDVDITSGALLLREVVKTREGPWALAFAPGAAAEEQVQVLQAGQEITTLREAGGPLMPESKTALAGDAVAVAPDGRFAYVVNRAAGTVTTLRRDPASGAMSLVPGGIVKTGAEPVDAVIDPNGWYLYVPGAGDASMSVYYLDPESGIPQPVRGSPVATGKRPVAVTLDPAARYAFVTNADSDNVSVYRGMSNVSPLVSESRRHGSPFAAGKEPVALAVEPTGRYAYVANAGSNDISVFRIHHQSGALASIPGSPFKTGQRPVALAAHPNGRWLYTAHRDSADVRVFSIETEHGALAPKGSPMRLPAPPKALWLNPAGMVLYVLAEDGRRLLSYKVDAATGSLSQLQDERLTQPITDMTFRVESRR